MSGLPLQTLQAAYSACDFKLGPAPKKMPDDAGKRRIADYQDRDFAQFVLGSVSPCLSP
ncbi:hypothetical protein SBA4_4530011 [Candidatus Sulfopaludibacter sp. SbA4]|nr:hypothetical protein SBA4_4530011 [Candidatus Sulfopaludibacter sp. SbA4]